MFLNALVDFFEGALSKTLKQSKYVNLCIRFY